jgi:hypothetical protein
MSGGKLSDLPIATSYAAYLPGIDYDYDAQDALVPGRLRMQRAQVRAREDRVRDLYLYECGRS